MARYTTTPDSRLPGRGDIWGSPEDEYEDPDACEECGKHYQPNPPAHHWYDGPDKYCRCDRCDYPGCGALLDDDAQCADHPVCEHCGGFLTGGDGVTGCDCDRSHGIDDMEDGR